MEKSELLENGVLTHDLEGVYIFILVSHMAV
jgi:hypothetical protein